LKEEGARNEGIERQMADKGSQRKRKKFKEKETRTQIEREKKEIERHSEKHSKTETERQVKTEEESHNRYIHPSFTNGTPNERTLCPLSS